MWEEGDDHVLDDHLPSHLRKHLEDTLWRPVGAQATLEALSQDPTFFDDPGRHPMMFADHGVVHVRDVFHRPGSIRRRARRGAPVGATAASSLSGADVGVAMTYLHDVGMVDASLVGRRTHALYAAHVAFSTAVDPLVEHLLAGSPVGATLAAIESVDPFGVPLDTVMREVLSLAAAHSKSTVPVGLLAERHDLARLMRFIVFTSMERHRGSVDAPVELAMTRSPVGDGVDHPSPADAFAWLPATTGAKAELADDVIDAVRIMRAADSLRQRGTTLRTSGGFEVFFDARSGQPMCTLRSADGRAAYLMTYVGRRGAGEANIRTAILTPSGDLRISFHRGDFLDPAGAGRAAESVADAILDIWSDAVPVFRSAGARGLRPPARTAHDMLIELERPEDGPGFADLVRDLLTAHAPELGERLRVVNDVESAAALERERYDRANRVDPRGELADEVVARMGEHGSDTSAMKRAEAFAEVRHAVLDPGEALVEHGSHPAFVYVPLGPGLRVLPLGGYAASPLQPWLPVGTTGAIRRAPRNADIVASRVVDVLMVPSQVYVSAWLHPLDPQSLRERLRSDSAAVDESQRARRTATGTGA